MNRINKDDLPTPESPIITIFNKASLNVNKINFIKNGIYEITSNYQSFKIPT